MNTQTVMLENTTFMKYFRVLWGSYWTRVRRMAPS